MTHPYRYLCRLAAAAVLLLLAAAPAWAGRARFEERLDRAIAAGAVDARRADLYRLFQLRDPGRLPAVLRGDDDPRAQQSVARAVAAEPRGRDGTGEMRQLRDRLARAPAAVRAEAEPYLARPPLAREGSAVLRGAGKSGRRTLQNRVITANFSVEWGPDLTDELGDPWTDTAPDFTGDPAVGGNGMPDVVERWAAYLEASFGVELSELGFAPDALAANLVPVYLGNSDLDLQIHIDDIAIGELFGFTDYTGRGAPYLVVNNNFHALLGLTSLADIQPLMKVTAAHEFFHVLHFLYEPAVASAVWEEEIWWWEASATWMEDAVFDSVDDYHSWFQETGGWADFAAAGLAPNFNDIDYAPRAYGAVIFAKYLEEHVGGRDSMRQVWDHIRPGGTTVMGRRVLDALDHYAQSRGFAGLEELYVGFSGANAVMDYEEGEAYGTVPWSGSTLNVANATDGLPAYLGATYRQEEGTAASGSGLSGAYALSLAAAPAVPWGLAAVVQSAVTGTLVLGGTDPAGRPRLSLAGLNTSATVWAAVSILDPRAVAGGGGDGDTGGGGGGGSGGGCFVAQFDGTANRSVALSATAYNLSLSRMNLFDTVPPAAVSRLTGTAAAGGFDLGWGAPEEPDVAGYVVRWTSASGDQGTRTLFGPIRAVQIRGLAVGAYDVSVFAYDAFGNADAGRSSTARITVSQAGADTPTPAVAMVADP